MQKDISLIIDAIRKASRFLQRDYFELENLQSSSKATEIFCNRSCSKTLERLNELLGKYYKTIIFENQAVSNTEFSDRAVIVEILDGFGNLSRSLPFFGTMVTIINKKYDKIVAEKSIMNFPVLGEIYYTEKGKGVWLERSLSNLSGASRVRVSGINDFKDSIVATNFSNFNLAQNISTNLRMFESNIYNLSLLVSGKVDALITNSRNILDPGTELFITEAGGNYHKQEDLVIASNFKLHEKIKSLL